MFPLNSPSSPPAAATPSNSLPLPSPAAGRSCGLRKPHWARGLALLLSQRHALLPPSCPAPCLLQRAKAAELRVKLIVAKAKSAGTAQLQTKVKVWSRAAHAALWLLLPTTCAPALPPFPALAEHRGPHAHACRHPRGVWDWRPVVLSSLAHPFTVSDASSSLPRPQPLHA